jgi:hypothetical protein
MSLGVRGARAKCRGELEGERTVEVAYAHCKFMNVKCLFRVEKRQWAVAALEKIKLFKTPRFWTPIFWKRIAVFLEIKIGNPLSKFTWNKMQFVSIECYKKKSDPMLYASVSTTHSFKRANGWSAGKVSDLSKKPPIFGHHLINHSIGKKHIFCHAKFEGGLIISFNIKYMSNKKEYGRWSVLFSKSGV